MDVLLTCGTCGLVEALSGSAVGPACPRCGSRAVEADEVVRNVPAYFLDKYPVLKNPHRPVTGFGGGHVPMTRAA